MRYALSTTVLFVAGCGTGILSPATDGDLRADARSRCRALGLPDDYIEATIHAVDDTVPALAAAMVGTPLEGDPVALANSAFSAVAGTCSDRFVDPACLASACVESQPGNGSADDLLGLDTEACCQVCDFDTAITMGIACNECTGAILEAELEPAAADALRAKIDRLMAPFDGLPENLCGD